MLENLSSEVEVGRVPPEQQARALWLVCGGSHFDRRAGQVAAFLASAAQGKISLEGLFQVRRAGRMVGAAWGLVMPGRLAVVWPPRLLQGEPADSARTLQTAVESYLQSGGVQVAQVVLDDAESSAAQQLASFGYWRAADLLYLLSTRETFPDSAPTSRLTYVPCAPGSDDQRLGAVVEATYRQTRDCPLLDGMRKIADVLEGYRHIGQERAGWWLIARHQQRDVGCLLLADHPQQQLAELIYMGIVPEARGQGFGLDLARQAQWLARSAGRDRVMLAVDADNEPALKLYAAAGFKTWDQKSVLLKKLSA